MQRSTLKRYRFCIAGTNQYVMIGARNDDEALREARRSTDKPGELEVHNGFIWVSLDSPLRVGLC